MLPLPDLDDRTFEQLVDEARKLIHQYAPQWNDHNLHDPGITIMELLAWLTEMQRFYLDAIRDDSYRKFIKLLGGKIREASPARTVVAFSYPQYVPGEVKLPVRVVRGSKFSAGGIIFETEQPLTVLNISLAQIVSATASAYTDNTRANGQPGLSYYAWGELADPGERLYLGFHSNDGREPKAGENLSMFFDMVEEYQAELEVKHDIPAGENSQLRADNIYWEYGRWSVLSAGDEKQISWVPVVPEVDETRGLSCSGRLVFAWPEEMLPLALNLCKDGHEYYWLRCTVQEDPLELAPRIKQIIINNASAAQLDTRCDFYEFQGSEGEQVDIEADYISLKGENLLQTSDQDGIWRDCADDVFNLVKDEINGLITLPSLPQGKSFRLLSWLDEFAETRWAGRSNGLPKQKLEVKQLPLLGESFALQVGEDEEGLLSWRDWLRVDDFDASAPDDRHYLLNSQTGEIFFGDGLRGAVPPVLHYHHQNNIRLIRCRLCNGEKGNTEELTINMLVDPAGDAGILVFMNPKAARGGAAPENLKQAETRMRISLQSVTRGVSCDDYEKLALSTPGLKVARAKAYVTFERPDSGSSPGYPLVQVVVVPYSNKSRPIPGPRFLQQVCCFLQARRLITTEIKALSPEYVEISVDARVVFKTGYKPDKDVIIKRLRQYLTPLDTPEGGQGWPFGRTVYKSELYAFLEGIQGVDYVFSLNITVAGSSAGMDASGNVILPPNGLACSGEHRIEAIPPGRAGISQKGCRD